MIISNQDAEQFVSHLYPPQALSGLNGAYAATINNTTDSYAWYSTTFSAVSAGAHTINIWEREDGALVDRLMFSNAATVANALASLPITLQINKQISGGTVTDPFNVTVTSSNGYSSAVAVTPGTPTIINNLEPGSYTMVEESPISTAAPAGLIWFAPSYEPAGGTIALTYGDTGTVTITNYLGEAPTAPTGVLTVTKTVDWNGATPNGSQQFARRRRAERPGQ